ncbi:MAG: SpoVR family protein [Planctomycetes bacterium]|nr:SpoVR family protein [Planctomycetota bacterium]
MTKQRAPGLRHDARSLPRELQEIKQRIRGYALEYGLDFFEVMFEMVDYDEMNMIAAYDGFPTRYPHWRFGMKYEELQKSYSYGLAKIYELVINNNPCYAYLMRNNPLVDQKLVMAHVYAHSDFFKNNAWFASTNRKMVDEVANHGTRVRRYIDLYGQDEVENFVDVCLSLENLIDIHSPYFSPEREQTEEQQERARLDVQGTKFKSKPYMEAFINPPEALEREKKQRLAQLAKFERFPQRPERDILAFLTKHAPLKRWQRDILDIVREEAYYFAPQRMTKIMNEGWASYWHSKIMTSRALDDSEIIEYADHHSGTLGARPGVLNPYKVGIELFRDIEDRWNRGRFGPEYDDCDNYLRKKSWDRNLGIGRDKIFQVRKIYNDITFIDEFFTEEFCAEQELFTFRFERQSGQYLIDSRQFREVKSKLLDSLANFGQPVIRLDDGNFKNRGELHLVHEFSGAPLKLDYARAAMENLYKLWTRAVHVETTVDGKKKLLSYNGSRHEERLLT